MPQFSRRSTRPPTPDTYLRLARLVRGLADKIKALAYIAASIGKRPKPRTVQAKKRARRAKKSQRKSSR
ncbi:MAG: hypothetical protein FJX52_02390 [Alphaproteobacteria bacterium]|nr:hypothetical protein [Alphaproteobacteria bacterium]